MTTREIAATLGINERTVRKIKAGETSGAKTYKRLTTTPRGVRATPNAFNAEFIVGYDADNNPIIASRNVIIPDQPTRGGGRRAPTALDVFRVDLAAVADAERAALARRYTNVARLAGTDSPTRLRSIGTMRKRAHIMSTRASA